MMLIAGADSGAADLGIAFDVVHTRARTGHFRANVFAESRPRKFGQSSVDFCLSAASLQLGLEDAERGSCAAKSRDIVGAGAPG